ncbi:LacI family DNA-binding transcriptional regulator [Leuconostoc citreum]
MVSIRDVARQAGLSPATVSRVLNQDDTLQVTEQTRQRVIEVANKLNYQLKKSGRRTAAHHSTDKLSIALISTFSEERELNDPYFRSIRTGIEVAATRWQIKVDMVFRLDAPKKLETIIAIRCSHYCWQCEPYFTCKNPIVEPTCGYGRR